MKTRTDSRQKSQLTINGDTLRKAVAWAIDAKIFAQLKFHGNTSWAVFDLVSLAIVWVWSDKATLTGAFTEARQWSMQVLKHAAVGTYQGLLKALVRWTPSLLPLMWERLQRLMEENGKSHWRVGHWLALAVDGSRISTPRTQANEKAFCAANFGKSNTAKYRAKKRRAKGVQQRSKKSEPIKPQIWTTLLWHMGLQMPWSWKLGPSNSSERDHFQTMLREQKFPKNALFCADAGFTGYELWKAIIEGGHSFLIRVGANVKLLRQLGYYVREHDGIVYCWPDKVARGQRPPLVLRLFCLQVGKCRMSLLSNIIDDNQLTDQQAIRLYRLRWGVELQFRAVKQTFGRRKLRSHTPERAQVELDWSLIGLWLIQLFAVKEQIEIGEIPEKCSVCLAIQIIREMMQKAAEKSEQTLGEKLRVAQKDSYQRKGSKKARYRPKYKDKPTAGHPKVVRATRVHKMRLRKYLKTRN
jgi:hypothetical protein